MIDQLYELDTASSLLQSALQRYSNACSALQCHEGVGSLVGAPRRAFFDCMTNEFSITTTHDIHLKETRLIIAQTINRFSSINLLPAEILAHIFQLVDLPCVHANKNRGSKPSRYPDLLAHVCLYWRRIAFDTPKLWTHVDLVYNHLSGQRAVRHAYFVATRASPLLLDLHLDTHLVLGRNSHHIMLNFLAAVASRVRSLKLTISPKSTYPHETDENREFIESCFRSCQGETLEQLAIEYAGGMAPIFISADLRGATHTSLEQLEPLHRIKTLSLEDVYFPWKHPIYCTLAELRLTCELPVEIPEPDLIGILRSSPGLRVLRFGLKITNTQVDPPPIHLPLLEVLDLTPMEYDKVGTLARLLAPVSRSLQFGVEVGLNVQGFSATLYHSELLSFLTQSNITKLVLKRSPCSMISGSSIDYLIRPVPQLRVLVLDGFNNLSDPSSDSSPCMCERSVVSSTGFCLDALYLLNCAIFLDTIQKTIQRHPVKTLTISGSTVRERRVLRAANLSGPELEVILSQICPMFRAEEEYTGLIKDWL